MKCSSARWIAFWGEHKYGTLHHIPSKGVWLGWPSWWWPHAGPVCEIHSFNGPSCFGTFNSITSADRNRSNFQNLMFQKLKVYNFQNNSHVYCKIPLSETFRLREKSFWILVTPCCWVSGFFQTSRTGHPVMQCNISEDWIVNYMAWKHQKLTQQSDSLLLKML